jgi:hypothetical protein
MKGRFASFVDRATGEILIGDGPLLYLHCVNFNILVVILHSSFEDG